MKNFGNKIKVWWDQRKLNKASSALDQEIKTIMLDIQRTKANTVALANAVNERIVSAVFGYLNAVANARPLSEGEERAPAFSKDAFDKLNRAHPSQTGQLGVELTNFSSLCDVTITLTREAASKGKNNASREMQFAINHSRIIEGFAALLTTCAAVLGANKTSLVSLAEAGKNSEGAKIALLVVGVGCGTYYAAECAYKCLLGTTSEVKSYIEKTQNNLKNLGTQFEELAKAAKAKEVEATTKL